MKRTIAWILAAVLALGMGGAAFASDAYETGKLDAEMIGTEPCILVPVIEYSEGTFVGSKTVRVVFAGLRIAALEGTLAVLDTQGETVAEADLSDPDLTALRGSDPERLYEVNLEDPDGAITEATEAIVFVGDVFYSEAFADNYTLALRGVTAYDEAGEAINTTPFDGEFRAVLMGGLCVEMDTETIHDYEQGNEITITVGMDYHDPYFGEVVRLGRVEVMCEGVTADKAELTPEDNVLTLTLDEPGREYIRLRCFDENDNPLEIESLFSVIIPVLPAAEEPSGEPAD